MTKCAKTFTHCSLKPNVSDLRGGSLRTTGRTRAATATAGRTGAAARTCRWCRRRTWRRQSSSFVCKCPRLAFFSTHATVTRTANLSLLWHCGLFCMILSQKMGASKSIESDVLYFATFIFYSRTVECAISTTRIDCYTTNLLNKYSRSQTMLTIFWLFLTT